MSLEAMKSEIHCCQDPFFCHLFLCFSNLGSRLIMGCKRIISGSPPPSLAATSTKFIVFKVLRVSYRTF
jgi:hypothetical protein